MAKFVVTERDRNVSGTVEYLVVNVEDKGRPVASFGARVDAQAHADKLNAGPLDWDEQEQWQDEDGWDDEDGAGSA